MTGFSEMESAAIIAVCDVSQIRTVVDVGGGQGALAAALLRAHAHLQAVIFDRSGPTQDTQRIFALADIAGRGRFIQGDFFAHVPNGGDLYLLKSILHNWDTLRCGGYPEEMQRCHAETRSPDCRGARDPTRQFAVQSRNSLTSTCWSPSGGRERTEAEYASLFHMAGMELTKVTPTTSHLSLVEAARSDRN